ncbi:BTAD domain-containing putative transcriptional regulator [Streptomyces sp. PTY087I2]|uniref:BTAD domain-containing putative transcriptional regulator n=1 Tax=Streptomyces sp. PTY087I2 TaxID=1819298 RepID=UPI00080B6380|nr:BTAD domain-containing putative transcriptional regulator [Streptomyces sp. PTY087I2]OCC10733.1 Transcriptional regulatory protein EmbR [Streptomyces sp. PTY087I2]
MEFQLLGPFAALHRGRPVLAGLRRQERCLLAVLALEAGRAVPTGRLIDLLWNGEAPAGARAAVHTYIGRLRAALGPDGVHVETRNDGYLLRPDGHLIDTRAFEDGVREAAAAVDDEERVRHYDRALALWRGELLADVADDALRDRIGQRLAALRLSAAEERARLLLALGRHERVAAELPPLAEEHPERERLVSDSMLALHRSGRSADALNLYRSVSGTLRSAFDAEPGRDLRTLYDRVRRDDPALRRPEAPTYAVRVRGEWLPWNTGGDPALEFCNTYAGWGGERRPGSEWLRGYRTLAVWAGHLDLLDDRTVTWLLRRAEERPGEASAVLEGAREFRGALYGCLVEGAGEWSGGEPGGLEGRDRGGRGGELGGREGCGGGGRGGAFGRDGAFGLVADVVQEAMRHAVFVRGEDGLGRWSPHPDSGLRLPLHAVAQRAADLLADPRRLTVRACPGKDCGWLFLDVGGRRRWCSLGVCGQRWDGREAG